MNSFRQLLRRGVDSRAVTLSDMETPLRAVQAAAAVARLMYGLSIAVARRLIMEFASSDGIESCGGFIQQQ